MCQLFLLWGMNAKLHFWKKVLFKKYSFYEKEKFLVIVVLMETSSSVIFWTSGRVTLVCLIWNHWPLVLLTKCLIWFFLAYLKVYYLFLPYNISSELWCSTHVGVYNNTIVYIMIDNYIMLYYIMGCILLFSPQVLPSTLAPFGSNIIVIILPFGKWLLAAQNRKLTIHHTVCVGCLSLSLSLSHL